MSGFLDGAGKVTVVLHATVRRNRAESTRTFVAKVLALPAKQDLKGYMFSYFTGESSATSEQIYFGLSKGNDPLNWQELNAKKPVLTTTDAGGPLEVVTDGRTGYVTAPEPSELARAAGRLRDHPEDARTYGRAGRELAARVTWDGCIDRLLA